MPHGRATPLGELQDDPHMKAVEFFKVYDHPTEGSLINGPADQILENTFEIRRLPALLGEHSIESLREVGLSDGEIGEMVDEGVTLDGRPEAEKVAAE